MKDSHDSTRFDSSTGGRPLTPFEQSKGTRKRCKGVTRSGTPCTAWAMEGGLCYFHANPDKASELGKRGGRAKSPTGTPGVSEYVARPLKSVDDVTKLLADTINDLRSETIDFRLANTVGFLATGMLKTLQQGDLDRRLRAMEAVLSSNKTSRPFGKRNLQKNLAISSNSATDKRKGELPSRSSKKGPKYAVT